MASGGPTLAALLPGAVVHEEGQDFADGGFLAGGLGQREVRLDLVAAAAAFPVLNDIPGAAAGSTVSYMVSFFRFGGGWDLGPAGRSHASAGPWS